jgi:hypothetical protein
MKTKRNKLGVLLESLLDEDNPAPLPQNMADTAPPESTKDVSLDAVLDRYIIRYEKESIPTSETYEDELYGEPTHESIIREALYEAPEDEEPVPEEEEPPPEEGGDLNLGEEDPAAAPAADPAQPGAAPAGPPPVMTTPQINLQDFARSLARLVNNYDALLNPRNIILHRIQKYVESNYDVRTAKELMEMLETNYSLAPDDKNEQEWPTPYAAGALSSEG